MKRRLALRWRVQIAIAAGLAAAIALGACESGAYPLDIFPEMHYQQSFRPGEPPLVPVPEGSVPTTGREIVVATGDASQLPNPVPATAESIAAGEKLFRNNCSMCHGVNADGNSQVALRFEKAGVRPPPNILVGVAQLTPDGFIYGVITNGQANMPSLQKLLTPEQRWTIINFLRVLQKAAQGS